MSQLNEAPMTWGSGFSETQSNAARHSLMARVRGSLVDPVRHELVVAGRVVLTPDGKPIRSILTGRKRRTTGSYASRKSGCGQVYESMVERAFFLECEVDTDVVDYRAQPFRIEVVIDGRLRTYIADCVRLMADGSVEVVEIKGSARQLVDPVYVAKLSAVRSVCAAAGWSFRVITSDQIMHPPVRYRNIEEVQLSKHVRYGAEAIYVAHRAIEECGGIGRLGTVADAVHAGPLGRQIVMAMMVGRVVSIDLEQPLSADSGVTLICSDGDERS
ncbi:TnsA endonuclease N-terminal domain-containing protein [Brevundimonas nasdae]|uniref:Uncharacterized protein n=1 Tax=Brevundimonas nasdae TaxID=172043 RepID=A0ACD4VPR3_9CAUL|nr:TnsA endonuclease N-terminal domain-containing protein [Brevundimonas nasdae]WOB78524.1 hypothetical protein PZA08_14660 [Brevundimonas nasdae]